MDFRWNRPERNRFRFRGPLTCGMTPRDASDPMTQTIRIKISNSNTALRQAMLDALGSLCRGERSGSTASPWLTGLSELKATRTRFAWLPDPPIISKLTMRRTLQSLLAIATRVSILPRGNGPTDTWHCRIRHLNRARAASSAARSRARRSRDRFGPSGCKHRHRDPDCGRRLIAA